MNPHSVFAEDKRRERRAGFAGGHAGSLLGVLGVMSECRHVAARLGEQRAGPEWGDGAFLAFLLSLHLPLQAHPPSLFCSIPSHFSIFHSQLHQPPEVLQRVGGSNFFGRLSQPLTSPVTGSPGAVQGQLERRGHSCIFSAKISPS